MLHSENIPSEAIPNYLVCPLSQQIFLQPVTVFPTGHVYEKEEIDKVIAKARAKNEVPLCPMTRQPITEYAIAWSVQYAVEDYLSSHKFALEEQYQSVDDLKENKQKATNVNDQRINDINNTNVNNLEMNIESLHAPLTTNSLYEASPDVLEQIKRDEEFARELQQSAIEIESRLEEEERLERDALERIKMSVKFEEKARNFYHEEQERNRLINKKMMQAHLQEINDETNMFLSIQEKKDRELLINEIQNIIYALNFEAGPEPQGRTRSNSLLFFSFIEKLAFIEPEPWQKIKVNEGPKLPAMYEVLKAAIRSLKELNEDYLNEAKRIYAGQYDLVQPLLGRVTSFGLGDYVIFPDAMRVKNQPGYLVNAVLICVNDLLQKLCPKYNDTLEEMRQLRRHGV